MKADSITASAHREAGNILNQAKSDAVTMKETTSRESNVFLVRAKEKALQITQQAESRAFDESDAIKNAAIQVAENLIKSADQESQDIINKTLKDIDGAKNHAATLILEAQLHAETLSRETQIQTETLTREAQCQADKLLEEATQEKQLVLSKIRQYKNKLNADIKQVNHQLALNKNLAQQIIQDAKDNASQITQEVTLQRQRMIESYQHEKIDLESTLAKTRADVSHLEDLYASKVEPLENHYKALQAEEQRKLNQLIATNEALIAETNIKLETELNNQMHRQEEIKSTLQRQHDEEVSILTKDYFSRLSRLKKEYSKPL